MEKNTGSECEETAAGKRMGQHTAGETETGDR